MKKTTFLLVGILDLLAVIGPTSPNPSETKSPDGTMVDPLTGESTGMDTCRGVGLYKTNTADQNQKIN